MSAFRFLAICLLTAFCTSNVIAQPGYYNSPPPGYNPPPPGYIPPSPQNIPPPAFYGNRGYANRGVDRPRPFNRYNNQPWNRNWNNNGNYGPDSDWFKNTPQRWTKEGPKEGAGQVFDDFLDAPGRMGDMPPGWSAPSISVPNPIDVADELERGSKDMIQINK